jgi:hypothetical protein
LQPSPLPAAALPPTSLPNNTLLPNTFVSSTVQTPAIVIPSVGAFLRGTPTEAHTWCPTGIVENSASIQFYPLEDSVAAQSDVLAATVDGNHILGASTPINGGNITLSDIGVTIPELNCLPPALNPNYPLIPGDTLSPLVLTTALSQATVTANAAAVNQVVAGFIPQVATSQTPAPDLAFITYTPLSAVSNTKLPYYIPGTGVGYVTLGGSGASSITAPVAGAFSPDNTLFFVSTAGDNQIHYINVHTLTDKQQIAPNLPACTPNGNDPGCLYSGSGTVVPATVITVTPRSTT